MMIVVLGLVFIVECGIVIVIDKLVVFLLGCVLVVSVCMVLGLVLCELVLVVFGNSDFCVLVVVLSGLVFGVDLLENLLLVIDGVCVFEVGDEIVFKVLLVGVLCIVDNVFLCSNVGVWLDGVVGYMLDICIIGN